MNALKEGRASRTASRVAFRRAAHQVLDAPLVFSDPLALRILSRDAVDALRQHPHRVGNGRYDKMMRAFLVVRSRIADDVITAQIAKGVRQVVILGAGLDTFAYRHGIADVRVFEIDHPATQAWKRRRLADAGIAIPETLTFVPVDFAERNLRDALSSSGVDFGAATVFSWLGVSMYLEAAAVWTTLCDVAAATAPGGGVVFDYVVPAPQLDWRSRIGLWLLERRVRRAGEPFRSFLDPGALTRGMHELGFSTIEDLDGAALNARYFARRADGLRVGSAGHVMVALR
ncbi:MAG TPA: SAM-dependent methyltransferase [Candidatus Polarisedimenticolaceae bacterium]|nr:SAM-dependent methyltransferase [Candidatus Polarisedimenticolaceae bacterium]